MAKILAFESSCDDTSVALIDGSFPGDFHLRSVAVQNQDEIHQKWGGVVPELASRAHLANLLPLLKKVETESGCSLEEIDAFAATETPGLVGCLLVGHTAAKTLSMLFQKPFISCHHLQGHIFSVFLEHRVEFPFLCAIVSGGHTSLVRIDDFNRFKVIAATLDDAMGEAFDKGAKLLGLGFPGGAELEALAETYDFRQPLLPLGKVRTEKLAFSFSGLKSEFARSVRKMDPNLDRERLAASYQHALIQHFFEVVEGALSQEKLSRFVLVGGVARNRVLRNRLEQSDLISDWWAPSPRFCTDNAAMIALLGLWKFGRSDFSSLRSDVQATSRRLTPGGLSDS